MIYRIVRLHFDPDFVANFLEVFTTRKSLIVSFDGCLTMKLLQDKEDPSVFFTISLWDSEENLNQYRKSPFFQEMWSTIKPWFTSKAEAWTTFPQYEGKNPNDKASSDTD